MCEPCLIDYQYFTKTETLNLDGNMILNVLDANSVGKFPIRHYNTNNDEFDGKYDSVTQKIVDAFKMVDSKTILELYKKFKWDFELFGYDIRPFLDLNDWFN